MKAVRALVFVDGAARGNPGPAAVGVIVRDPAGAVLGTISRTLGSRTNNQAEYEALLAAVGLLTELSLSEAVIHTDSELLFNQLTGRYRVRNAELQRLLTEIERISRALKHVEYRRIPRQENREADRLANQALDRMAKAGPGGDRRAGESGPSGSACRPCQLRFETGNGRASSVDG